MKVLLVCSSGGHFAAMLRLQPFWQAHERSWVTFRSAATAGVLAGERVYWAFSPTNRNLINLVRNLVLAVTVLITEKPDLVLTTGAGVAVPFLLLDRLRRCRVAFVESITRTESLSMPARLVLPFSEVYVQWPELQKQYPKTIYTGAPFL